MAQRTGRPTTGVFIAWDDEDVAVERIDAGTIHDRTVVRDRRMVTRYALWSNAITDKLVATATVYASGPAWADYTNVRVVVFTKEDRRP